MHIHTESGENKWVLDFHLRFVFIESGYLRYTEEKLLFYIF